EKLTLHIKNMVCDRCVMVLDTTLTALGLEVEQIQLGKAEVLRSGGKPSMKEIEKELDRFNFGLISDADTETAEKIKIALIELLNSEKPEEEEVALSDYLAKKLNKNYASLSRIFSRK